jgi:SHAQKYF class myb-like DNA-binding protein
MASLSSNPPELQQKESSSSKITQSLSFEDTPADECTTPENKEEEEQNSGRRTRRAKLLAQSNMKALPGSYSSLARHYKGNVGRWKIEEHIKFLQGLKRHGKNWKQVEKYVQSRNGPQIRSHAQKFFKRIQANCSSEESPIDLLKRTNFSIEVILSGIDENEDKLELSKKLKEELFNENLSDNAKGIDEQRDGNTLINELNDSQASPHCCLNEKEELEASGLNTQKKFSYFPSSYKMSTMDNPIRKQSEEVVLPKLTFESDGSCIQLKPSLGDISNKRKHSEMVRLDKIVRVDNFHAPTPKDFTEISGRKRVNKLLAKDKRRQRLMTETASDVKSRIGFLPTKFRMEHEQYFKNAPRPEIGRCLNFLTHRLSTDSASLDINNSARGGKKVKVVVIKKDEDLFRNNPKLVEQHSLENLFNKNRLRFQTF